MAKGIYVGAGGVKVSKKIYVGAGGVKQVKKIYVGVGGIPKLAYSAEFTVQVSMAYPSGVTARSGWVGTTYNNYAIFYGSKNPATSEVKDTIRYDANLVRTSSTSAYYSYDHSGSTNGTHAVFTSGATVYSSSSDTTYYSQYGTAFNSSFVASNVGMLVYNKSSGDRVGNYAVFHAGDEWSGTSGGQTSKGPKFTVLAVNQSLVVSTAPNLSVKRADMQCATIGDNIIFIGGQYLSERYEVDAYNSSLVKVTIAKPTMRAYNKSSGYKGEKIPNAFAAFTGESGFIFYDTNLVKTESPIGAVYGAFGGSVSIADSIIMLAGGASSGYRKNIDYFDSSKVLVTSTAELPVTVGMNRYAVAKINEEKFIGLEKDESTFRELTFTLL